MSLCKVNLAITGVLVSTSLGAYGPLFGSDYIYDADALGDTLTELGVTFPSEELARGELRPKPRSLRC